MREHARLATQRPTRELAPVLAWAAAGFIAPLDKVAPSGAVDELKKDIAGFALTDVTYKDKVYGLPYYSDTISFIYNKKILADAGIPVPATWEEVTAAAEKLKAGGMEHPIAYEYNQELPNFYDAFVAQAYGRGAEMFDKDLPESVRGGQVLTGMTASQARLPVAPSFFKFTQQGKAGHWVSELFPYTGKVADELCVIKSLYTEAINHEPAILHITTGNMFAGRPSIVTRHWKHVPIRQSARSRSAPPASSAAASI